MRVTGGELRGRTIRAPGGQAVRPTQDLVRGALFSILARRIAGARFLDLYAGSGSVGLDAWSRGAACVRWVESDAAVFRVLKENIERLCPTGDVRAVRSAVEPLLKRFGAESPFDLVYCDPPYRKTAKRGRTPAPGAGRAADVLGLVAGHGVLAPGGLLIFEQGADEPAETADGWELRLERAYGRTVLRFYGRVQPAAG